ncbi:MAG: 50S ribosomal protein L24 [Candidatus Yonathbacteria bacterium]|nr:50S ribosomal protein L24 [Candidatus Yonathbacteria bacterium]
MNIKKGDNVIIIAGKDKGKKGKVVRALPADFKVVVEGVNMRKKHQRAGKGRQKGQTIEITMPIHVSNVMIEDPKTGKPTRIGKKVAGGKRIRIAKKSGTEL